MENEENKYFVPMDLFLIKAYLFHIFL